MPRLFLITSKCKPAKTSPFQQATVLVASCPSTKDCAHTMLRRRNNDGQYQRLVAIQQGRLDRPRQQRGRLQPFGTPDSLLPRLCTILTPVPPEVPSALSTERKSGLADAPS